MKASRILLAALLALAFLLGACGRTPTAEPEAPGPAEASPEPGLPEALRLPSLSLEESQAMASFLNANRALVWVDRLYCYDFGKKWTPVLARYTWRDGELSDFTVLAEDCIPEYLCRQTGWLYFIDARTGDIERISEKGGTPQVLQKGPCNWLSLQDGLLYYCDWRGRFFSMEPGVGRETLLLEGPCSFAFPLGDLILYLDADRDDQLRVYSRADGSDAALSEGRASPPLIWEDRIWYHSGCRLYSLDLNGQDPQSYAIPENDGPVELLPTKDGLLLRGLRDENGPVQWAGPLEGTYRRQGRGYEICDWLGEGLRIDTVYEPDGRIRGFRLTGEKGVRLTYLAGESE